MRARSRASPWRDDARPVRARTRGTRRRRRSLVRPHDRGTNGPLERREISREETDLGPVAGLAPVIDVETRLPAQGGANEGQREVADQSARLGRDHGAHQRWPLPVATWSAWYSA